MVLSATDAAPLLRIAKAHGVPAKVIGRVTGAHDGFSITTLHSTLQAPVERLAEAFHEALPRAMSRTASFADAATLDPSLSFAGGTA